MKSGTIKDVPIINLVRYMNQMTDGDKITVSLSDKKVTVRCVKEGELLTYRMDNGWIDTLCYFPADAAQNVRTFFEIPNNFVDEGLAQTSEEWGWMYERWGITVNRYMITGLLTVTDKDGEDWRFWAKGLKDAANAFINTLIVVDITIEGEDFGADDRISPALMIGYINRNSDGTVTMPAELVSNAILHLNPGKGYNEALRTLYRKLASRGGYLSYEGYLAGE